MPKMKSVKGAVKRFKVKKNGTIKRGSAFRSHILTKKTQKRKISKTSNPIIFAYGMFLRYEIVNWLPKIYRREYLIIW